MFYLYTTVFINYFRPSEDANKIGPSIPEQRVEESSGPPPLLPPQPLMSNAPSHMQPPNMMRPPQQQPMMTPRPPVSQPPQRPSAPPQPPPSMPMVRPPPLMPPPGMMMPPPNMPPQQPNTFLPPPMPQQIMEEPPLMLPPATEDEEPVSKKAKMDSLEAGLIDESTFLQQNRLPVTFRVQVPELPDKPEWQCQGQTLKIVIPLNDQVCTIDKTQYSKILLTQTQVKFNPC